MSTDPNAGICPVCGSDNCNRQSIGSGRRERIRCPNCGDHEISAECLADIPSTISDDSTEARVAYGVRKLPAGQLITTGLVTDLAAQSKLPPALERIDNLLLHLAESLAPGKTRTLLAAHLQATVGAASMEEADWVLVQAWRQGLIDGRGDCNTQGYRGTVDDAFMTVAGWERHAELVKDGAGSRHAFMAMKFGDAELFGLYRDHLRPATEQTGFELRTTNEGHQTAGSIDNRMRVEIRTSRFMVCDLTHGNRGAYWEAGFAEGLGRPVFYICREDILKNPSHVDHPHFDIRQQLIVPWNPDDPAPAMETLTATIRATLPAEARMQDR